MKKYAGLSVGLLLTIAVVGGLVYAVTPSPGEDFEWVSTGTGGIRVGEAGDEGEGIEADTLKFANPDSGIVFAEDGHVGSAAALVVSSETMTMVAAAVEGEELSSALVVSVESFTEGEEANCTAGLMSVTGGVTIASGHFAAEGEGEPVFVPHAGVVCSHTGDVVVQLGLVAPGGEGEGGESMMAGGGSGGDSLMQEITENATISDALAQDVADTVSATNAWTTGFRLRLPTHRFTQ
jgi:hypothetical protein